MSTMAAPASTAIRAPSAIQRASQPASWTTCSPARWSSIRRSAMRLPSASAAQAVISEMTRPAPSDAAMRRNGASVMPDIGASSTGFGNGIEPMKMVCMGFLSYRQLRRRPHDFDANGEPGPRGDINQRVEAELIDAAADEIIHPGLGQPKALGGDSLSHFPCPDSIADGEHHLASCLHVCSLRRCSFDGVPDAAKALTFHFPTLRFSSLYRAS